MQRTAMCARRSFLSLFLAVLLAVRLASPFGFMPGEANGSLALVECPDAIPIPSAHHGMHHEGGAKAKSTCPFAAGMAPAGPLPEVATVEALPEWPSEAVLPAATDPVPAGARVAPRPPSRAPPQA
jgi:hypothetical protein